MSDTYTKSSNGILVPSEFKNTAENFNKVSEIAQFIRGKDAGSLKTDYATLKREGYLGNATAATCVNLIANSIGSLKWVIKDKRTKKIVEDTELEALLVRPSPCMSMNQLFYTIQLHKLIAGNAYLRKISLNNGVPVELEILDPENVIIMQGTSRLPLAYQYTYSEGLAGSIETYNVNQVDGSSDVLQIKTFNPNSHHYGLSALALCSKEIQQMNLGNTHNASLLKNGANPGGLFSFKEELDPEQQDKISEKINSRFVGAKNSGKPIVASDVKYQSFSQNARELDYNNSRIDLKKTISTTLGVPPQLIGDSSASTFSNVAEMRLHFFENTVLPAGNIIRDELNNWLCPLFGGNLMIDYDENEISALQPRRDAVFERYDAINVLTKNEKRIALGFEALPEFDEAPTEEEVVDETEEEVVDEVVEDEEDTKSVAVIETKAGGISDDELHTHEIYADGTTSPAEDGHVHSIIDGDDKTSIVQGHRHQID